MEIVIIAASLSALMLSAHAQSAVTFCDLLRNPEKYNGQQVRVRVTYRYGFEWSELFCMECLEKGKAWLDRVNRDDAALKKAFRKMPKGSGIVNITVRGVFMSAGPYGHQGLRYQITPDEIQDVKVLVKGTKRREVEERIEKERGCVRTDPR